MAVDACTTYLYGTTSSAPIVSAVFSLWCVLRLLQDSDHVSEICDSHGWIGGFRLILVLAWPSSTGPYFQVLS